MAHRVPSTPRQAARHRSRGRRRSRRSFGARRCAGRPMQPLDPRSVRAAVRAAAGLAGLQGRPARRVTATSPTTKNYSSAIIFTHGNHIMVQCSACHTRFPHRADGHVERPTMKGCFDCHGLRHGPMGIIATGRVRGLPRDPAASACAPRSTRTTGPARRTSSPANKEFNTRVRDVPQTRDVHRRATTQRASSGRPTSWDYDSERRLPVVPRQPAAPEAGRRAARSRSRSPGSTSRRTSDLTCQQCHPDFRYDDKPAADAAVERQRRHRVRATCHRATPRRRRTSATPCRALQQVDPRRDRSRTATTESATCGSCHGGHFIYRLDTELGKAAHAHVRRTACALAASSTATSTTPTTTTTTARRTRRARPTLRRAGTATVPRRPAQGRPRVERQRGQRRRDLRPGRLPQGLERAVRRGRCCS